MIKYIISSILAIVVFTSCQDHYIITTYNKQELNTNKDCIKLKLSPFSMQVYNYLKDQFNITKDCQYELYVRYKTNIACNSPYKKTDKFNAFIEYKLSKKDNLIVSYYVDTNTRDFNTQLKQLTNDFQANLNFSNKK